MLESSGFITAAAGADNDHQLLLSLGIMSADAWSLVKSACMYTDVIDHLAAMNRTQESPCHDVVVHFASDYDAIICDAALVGDATR